MAGPYRVYSDDDDDDEDENMDPAVVDTINDKTLAKAIQMSLKVSPFSQTLDHSTPNSLQHFSLLARQIL